MDESTLTEELSAYCLRLKTKVNNQRRAIKKLKTKTYNQRRAINELLLKHKRIKKEYREFGLQKDDFRRLQELPELEKLQRLVKFYKDENRGLAQDNDELRKSETWEAVNVPDAVRFGEGMSEGEGGLSFYKDSARRLLGEKKILVERIGELEKCIDLMANDI